MEERNCLNAMHHFIVMTRCLQRCIWCYIVLCSDSWKWVVRHARTFVAFHIKDESSWNQDTATNSVNVLHIWKAKRWRSNSQINKFSCNIDSQHNGIQWEYFVGWCWWIKLIVAFFLTTTVVLSYSTGAVWRLNTSLKGFHTEGENWHKLLFSHL